MEVTQAATSDVYKEVSPAKDQVIKQEKKQEMVKTLYGVDYQGHIIKDESSTSGVSITSSGTETFLAENQQMHHQMGQDLFLESSSKISSLAQTEATIKGSDQCQICDTTFPDESHLWNHRAVHLDVNAIRCQTCNRAFRSVDELRRHEGIHSKDNPFSCDLCGEAFRTRKALLKHEKTTHSGGSTDSLDAYSTLAKKHTCAYCLKTFKRRCHLVEHERIHTNDKPYDCFKCGKAFMRAHLRTKHMMKVHPETRKSYLCSKCNISFQTYFLLVKHKQLHRDRPHACGVCKTLFPTSKNLQKHLRHPKKDDYTCYVCNKKFRSHPNLKKHLGSHKDVPSSYVCEKCSKSFKTASLLQKHRRVHQKLNTHVCRFCQKNFKGVGGLQLHMLTHNKARRKVVASSTKTSPSSSKTPLTSAITNTSKRYSCGICSNIFETYYRMRQHKKMHQERPFMCDTCEETFVSRADLHQHKHGECADACICDLCNKAFISENKLQRHKIKHVLERPYLCGICLQPFKTTTQLKAHMLIHRGKKPLKFQQGRESKRMLDPLSLTSLVASTGDKESEKCRRLIQDPLKSDVQKIKKSRLKHGKQVLSGKRPHRCECGRTFKQRGDLKQHKLIHKIVHLNLSSFLDELSTNQPRVVTLPESHVANFSNSPLIGSVTIPIIPSVAVMPSSYPVGSLPGSWMDQPQVASVSSGSQLGAGSQLYVSAPILDQVDAADSFHCFVCDICQEVLPSNADLDCHRQNHVVAELATGSIIHEAIKTVHSSPQFGNDLAVAASSDDREKSDYTKTQVSDSDGDFGHEDLSDENSELVELSCTAILSPPENTKETPSRSRNCDGNLPDGQSSSGNASHTSAYQLFTEQKCQVVVSKLQYFSCGICNKDFSSLVELDGHKSAHQDGSSVQNVCSAVESQENPVSPASEGRHDFTCRYCGKNCRSQSTLQEHERSHTRENLFKCEFCNSEFARRYALKAHIQRDHKEKEKIQVDHLKSSGQSVNNQTMLDNAKAPRDTNTNVFSVHKKPSFKAKRRFACVLCDKAYLAKGHLKEHHIRAHTNIREFKCRFCSKEFCKKYDCQKHEQVHSKKENPVSKAAKRTSDEASQVLNKIAVHKCQSCLKVFKSSTTLEEHKKNAHESNRPYQCDKCDKNYLNRGHLLEHMNRVHLGIVQFKCSFCSKEFSKRHDGYRHEETHKKKQNSLSSASIHKFKDNIGKGDTGVVDGKKAAHKESSAEGSSNSEAVIHKCEFCLKIFESFGVLKDHKSSTHSGNRPYQCDQCDKNYLTKWHLREHHNRNHRERREFKCSFCPKGFIRRHHLFIHENTHTDRKRQNALSSANNRESVDEVHVSGTGAKADEGAASTKESSAKDSSNRKKTLRVRDNAKSFAAATSEQEKPDAKNDQNDDTVPEKAVSRGVFIHKCCDCQEEFWSADVLKEQSKTDKDDCEQCERMKSWLEILKGHYSQADHHIERLECCECKKKFFEPEEGANREKTEVVIGDDNEHQRSRSADLKASSTVKCRLCKKVFQNLLLLRKHKGIAHTKERQFKCGQCEKMYFTKSHLKEHEIRVHTNREREVSGSNKPGSDLDIPKWITRLKYSRKPAVCKKCGKVLKNVRNLKYHYIQVHTRVREFKCSYCDKEFCSKVKVLRHEYIHLKEEEHECRRCKEKFSSRQQLDWHKRNVHIEMLRCDKCGKVVAGKHHLKDHYVRVHSDVSLLSCKLCGKGFCRSSELSLHEYMHAKLLPPCSLCGLKHLKLVENKFSFYSRQKRWNSHSHKLKYASEQKGKKQRFQCMTCGASFSGLFTLIHHLEVHQAGKVPIFCLPCGKHFTSFQHLWRHKTMFHSRKHLRHLPASSEKNTMMCVRCGERFAKRALLLSHMSRAHLKQRKHVCNLCQASFATSWRLESHRQQVHPGGKIRLFVCKICNMRFPLRYHLRIHSKLHSSSTVFTCTSCGQEFQTERCLLAHNREHKRKQFMCDHCGKCFPNQSALKAHLAIHSDVRRFICERCGKAFKRKSGLWSHSKVHLPGNDKKDFICETCGRSFPEMRFLGIHRRTHSDKRRKCKVCNLVLKNQALLTIHMRKHTGERPYRCQYCPKRFRFRNIVRDHENIHTGKKPHICKICGASFASHGTLYHHKRVHRKKETTKGKKTKA